MKGKRNEKRTLSIGYDAKFVDVGNLFLGDVAQGMSHFGGGLLLCSTNRYAKLIMQR